MLNRYVMKRLVIVVFFWCSLISFALAQNVEEGTFLKRVEHNMIMLEADYNLKSKGDIEKLFWGNFNAPVEFFYSPAFEGASGFRIVRDSLNNSCILEVKHISNMEWVRTFNRSEWLNRYKIDFLHFSISALFAEDLYRKTVSFINNFKVKGMPHIAVDGYSITFRTVVDDEVWSLWISNPQGKNVLKMSDLCREIITDALNGKLDEQKYLFVLNTFEK
jgi:hypothetical protein